MIRHSLLFILPSWDLKTHKSYESHGLGEKNYKEKLHSVTFLNIIFIHNSKISLKY